ncbi:UNVERIFIED_CONTAM: Glycerol-3-phosphate acyltransferase 9 [Sesamum radiatum]|uniref:Glycerol-3-phosphate acyltransferase 9 n=1 Tax=Sesamum radiatum TaxID=300843 RepID=A0AAW2MSQ9_SESRA
MSKLNKSNSELDLDRPNIEDYLPSGSLQDSHPKLRLRDLLDISPTLTEAAGAIVDDSFTRCFKSNPPEPWNWNVYLFPLWCLGVVVRYGVLFPLRAIVLTTGWIIFLSCYFPVHFLLKGHDKLRKRLERGLVELICSFFVASWTGVVKYHGPRPSMRPKQVFVANHTSMIDFIVLEQMTAFAVIMQKHPGWVGLLQSTILESLGCIWFNRSESKDREIVARKLREHVNGADNNPLLIFPEGTCVNNHYTVMFKKLMTSWAVVCDVWYLEPQNLKPGETPIEFAERVRDIISVRAGLKKVPWDGYLKYSRPSPKLRERNPSAAPPPAPPAKLSSTTSPQRHHSLCHHNPLHHKKPSHYSWSQQPPSLHPTTFPIAASQTIKIPFPCICTNGAGFSNHRPNYTVLPGDTLYHIAAEVFSGLVTYPQIQAVNNISDPNLIEVGQTLWIPLPCSCDDVDGQKVVHYGHVVAPGSTVEGIAQQYNTSQDTLLRLNNLTGPQDLKAGAVLDVPLRACSSMVSNNSVDYPLLVANDTYVFTATNCVRCKCDAAVSWMLQCEASQINSSCPAIRCEGAENFYLGNTTTSSGCNRTTCEYAGYNQTILTTAALESTCPGGYYQHSTAQHILLC